jgi:hypothetical protein
MGKVTRRKVSNFEAKYGDVLMFQITCGLHQPTVELASDIEAYCVEDPRMRPHMERWLRENEREFNERAAKREREKCHA